MSGTDYSLVGTRTRLGLLAAIRRQRAELDAREAEVLAALATDRDPYRDGAPDLGKQWIREDVACALRVPSGTAGAKLQVAVGLLARFPATVQAMRDGVVDARCAARLLEATTGLDEQSAAQVEQRVLVRAGSQTFAQFAASLRRAVLSCDPRTARQRELACRADRRVVFTPVEDGMTELWALLPAEQAAALQTRIHQLAKTLPGAAAAADGGPVDTDAEDPRTADQRRADALCALGSDGLNGAEGADASAHGAGGVRARGAGGAGGVALGPSVQVSVALSTLLQLDDQPAELAGHGPISAELARAIAFDPTGTWRRLVTDEHGRLVDVSSQTYRPPAPMARLVRLRDQTCRFPGCRRNATRSELDHVRAFSDGGSTCPANLIALCPRHHHLKHDGHWQISRHTDGSIRWISPTGHAHDQPPPDPQPLDTTAILLRRPGTVPRT